MRCLWLGIIRSGMREPLGGKASTNNMSNDKRVPGCLGYIGDEKLPNFYRVLRIPIDQSWPKSIMDSSKGFFRGSNDSRCSGFGTLVFGFFFKIVIQKTSRIPYILPIWSLKRYQKNKAHSVWPNNKQLSNGNSFCSITQVWYPLGSCPSSHFYGKLSSLIRASCPEQFAFYGIQNFPQVLWAGPQVFRQSWWCKTWICRQEPRWIRGGCFLDRKKGDMFLKLSFLRKGKSVNRIWFLFTVYCWWFDFVWWSYWFQSVILGKLCVK